MAIGDKYVVTQAGEDYCLEFNSRHPGNDIFKSGDIVVSLENDDNEPYVCKLDDYDEQNDLYEHIESGVLIWSLSIGDDLKQC
jgi:hypothetical protein